MNILKKILAFALILWMFWQTTINSFAEISISDKVIAAQLPIVSEIKNWQKIIDKIDDFISKIDDKKVSILENKITIISQKLSEKKSRTLLSKKERDIILVLNYLDIKIKERKSAKLIFDEVKDVVEKELMFSSSNLSESDNEKVNSELIKIQNNILNYGVESFEAILWELENISNFEEKGDFNAKINIDHELVWKLKAELNLEDYVSKNSWFDSQFKTKVEAVIDSTIKWQKDFKLKANALVEYILKDQNYYVLLEKFNITDEEWIEEFEVFIEKAKELASKNKYIHFEDKNTQQIIEQIKYFSPENILSEWKKIASKPLFRAYKKDWNKYYLVPSKYWCDTAKKLAKKFDPFNGDTCTEWQYKDLLEDIAESKAEFYIDFSGKNTKIWFEADQSDEELEKFNWEINFSDKYIEEIKLIAIPDQVKFSKQGFKLDYDRNSNLDINIYAKEKDEVILNLKSTLDRDNNFSFIDFSSKINEFESELKLKNRKISWKYNFEKNNDKLVWIISWKTDYKNELSELNISNQIINLSENNSFENLSVFDYSDWSINLTNNYSWEWIKSEFNIGWKIKNNTLVEWNIKLLVEEKKSTYNYDTYERVYTWDFKKVIDSNIELKNKKITGLTTAYKSGKEVIKIINTWKIEKDIFELNTKILPWESLTNMSNMMFSSNTNEIIWNINFKIDITQNNNNGNFYVDLILDSKKVLDFEIDNKSTKIYKKVNIEKPNDDDIIPMEEVIENPVLY